MLQAYQNVILKKVGEQFKQGNNRQPVEPNFFVNKEANQVENHEQAKQIHKHFDLPLTVLKENRDFFRKVGYYF